MNKEELKKEAEEKAKEFSEHPLKEFCKFPLHWTDFDKAKESCYISGYLAGAEPREKRIDELEKEKCELLGIIQGKDTAIQDLQKENAELKESADFWEGHYWILNDVYVEVATKNDNKLIEAKEIIDTFLDFESSCQERGIYISDEMREKANKFLEEE